jgi:hypothetical protein
VDEDGQGDGRVVRAGSRRPVGLLRPCETLDYRVDGLEMARIRGNRDLDLPRRSHARLRRGEVVLDVARPAFRVGDECVDRTLALELAEDRGVRTSDDMCENVEAPSVSDADEHLVRTTPCRELDRLVEHRHEDVEPFDGELLLPDERAAQIGLERLHAGEPAQQLAPLVRV